MKKALLILAALCFILNPADAQYITQFKTGIFSGSNEDWLYNSTTNGYLTGLGIDQLTKYTYHFDADWTNREGGFNDSITNYRGNISLLVNNLINSNRQVLLEREKIVRPAYGQQSDYQAEMTNPQNNYPGYGWQSRNGITYSETWQDESVKGLKSGEPDNTGGWLLMNLYENGEQTNTPGHGNADINNMYPHQYYLSDNKLNSNNWRWHVQPRMRISVSDAFGTNEPVCRIVVIPYDGDTTDGNTLKFDLFTSDFSDKDGNYNGEYLQVFYSGGSLLPTYLTGATLNRGNPISYDGRSENPTATQVDYRIYWYGQVKVWIDRVRVEDTWSYYLFNPELEDFIQKYNFVYWIKKAAREGIIKEFTPADHEYNQTPCIKELNRIIKSELASEPGMQFRL